MKPNDKKSILPVDKRPFSVLIIKGSGRNKYNCPGVDNKARMLIIKMANVHAWAIIGPVNWYAPASNLKLMFDRLVCMNGGNTDEKLMSYKDPEKAIALEKSEQWKDLVINHLKGTTTGFFATVTREMMNWIIIICREY
jgi:multimeric flavodoxin WrbA